jgi:hypothetical protein
VTCRARKSKLRAYRNQKPSSRDAPRHITRVDGPAPCGHDCGTAEGFELISGPPARSLARLQRDCCNIACPSLISFIQPGVWLGILSDAATATGG